MYFEGMEWRSSRSNAMDFINKILLNKKEKEIKFLK